MKPSYVIICIVFAILILIKNRFGRMKRKDKAIAIALRECDDAMFFLGILGLLIGFCYIIMPGNSYSPVNIY